MPKKTRDFPDRLHFMCSTDLRQRVVALAYLRGSGGNYAAPARDMLTEKVMEVISNLDERQRADFQEILETIQAREALEADNKKAP